MQQQLTPAGQNLVDELSRRYGISRDAVLTMLMAVNSGGGSMAQFWCSELGGGGQWMRGGMTMVGDMFNSGLRNTVDNLCNELSNALATMQLFPVAPPGSRNSNQWWPGDLGSPFSSGGQNSTRYAVFPNRLAVEVNGQVTVYDTLNHSIGGVSQQQGNDTNLSFSSQFGTLSVASLPIVSGPGLPQPPQNNFAAPSAYAPPPVWQPDAALVVNGGSTAPLPATGSADDVFALIEKLSRLHGVGALTDAEYNAKKNELLSRI